MQWKYTISKTPHRQNPAAPPYPSSMTYRPFDLDSIRSEFAILNRRIGSKPLCYLDSAASAQKPDSVIDAMATQSRQAYANVHRGLHTLANETTEAFEAAREDVRRFLNAPTTENIVFTKGATEAINLVASGLSETIKPGDEILLSVMEHHSNIVPWHFLRERYGVQLRWVELTADGALDFESLSAAISPKTRLVAISHMSNVLGTVNDVARIAAAARDVGALTLFDGCQAAVHLDIDVQAIGCDFYVFSGHKLYGPTGIGALYGTSEALDQLQPYQGGGEMIESVGRDRVTYNKAPHKFEAGTPPIIQAIGLGAAIKWFEAFDRADIRAHEAHLYQRTLDGIATINGLTVHGTAPGKGAVLSFSLEGAHPHDIAQIVDRYGVAIRAGHHCAQPLMSHLGVSATARASFGLYNTEAEVDMFLQALETARGMLV